MALLKFGIAAIALLLAAPVRAEWTVTSAQTARGTAPGLEHRRVLLAESETGADATLDLALFSTKSATLRVIDNPNRDDSLAATMQREECLAGVNGGYFDPEYAPVGLLMGAGRVIAPFRKARLLSGVVSVVNKRVRIQRSGEFSMKAKPSDARQCGPFLLEQGKPITGLNETRSARRSFVATGNGERAVIGISSHVTLAQLAAVLAVPGVVPEMKMQRALNLDGGSSSGFWFAGKNGAVSIPEQKRVRDYLAIVPK